MIKTLHKKGEYLHGSQTVMYSKNVHNQYFCLQLTILCLYFPVVNIM